MSVTVNTNNMLTMSSPKIAGTTLLFHKFDPPALTLDNITHNTWDQSGKIQSNNGGGVNPLHGEWGLERVLDTQAALWTWFTNTNQQGVAAQQDTVTITILQSDGKTTLATWTLNKTTPISYSQSAHDANSNAVMTESVRFYSADITYTPGS